MRYLIQLVVLACLMIAGIYSEAQTLNTTQLGHLPYNQSLSEVRGAQHNGREYALVGVNNGFSIVDVTNASSPSEVFFEAGPSSIWRDPFYHNSHAYCVTEGGGGLLIVDMSPLPSGTNLTTTLYTGSTYDISSCHNMFIESATNRAYLFGGNEIEGAIILDISNPMSPIELGVWDEYYIHDGFVRGDTLWAGCLEEGAFLVDVSTPTSPVVLANWDTPSQFTHNIWPSDDNSICYTTDEVNSGFIAIYDMSDLQNVVETDRVRHPLSEGVIPHNAHYMNDYVISSHYRDGLTIHDVSDPSNVILTGYFDSSPLSGSGFNGSWGAWPYLASGNMLIADIEEGLFIVGVTLERAARLEGTVTEFGTGTLLNDVIIEVIGAGLNENSDLFGDYATGTSEAGTYSVSFQKGGYITQTISGVSLVNGQTEVLDVELVPDVSFNLSGTVTEEGTGNPINGATIQFVNQFFDVEYTSDGSGAYTDSEFFAGQYDVMIGAWGYVGECMTIDVTSSGTSPSFELTLGYHDDFGMDLGWTVSGDATAGVWERGVPIETSFESSISNPGVDVDDDCGDMAFVTGNGGGSAGNDDVDDGITILKSPIMDLSDYASPEIHFDYWFFNAGGNAPINDRYLVKIDDGADITLVGDLALTNNTWTPHSISIESLIAVTSTMQLIIEVEDTDPGHLVEGGLDKFRVVQPTDISEADYTELVAIYPNPTSNVVNIKLSAIGTINIYDVAGKLVLQQNALSIGVNQIEIPVPGVYVCEVLVNKERHVQRLLVH